MTAKKNPSAANSPGPAVDAAGVPVLDPTANVLDLVAAAMRRQDDLRDLTREHDREMRKFVADCDHEKEILRDKIRSAESERIDAIRGVDVGAAQILANATQAAAEALRNQVTAAAEVARAALRTELDPLKIEIAALRQAQYQAQGEKTNVSESRLTMGTVFGAISVTLVFVFGAATVLLAVFHH